MPSEFARADVARIAALARLELTETESEQFAEQLGAILEYARRVQEVDTTGVPPFTSMSPADQLREDIPVSSLSQHDALMNAPEADRDAGTFVVPKVIG